MDSDLAEDGFLREAERRRRKKLREIDAAARKEKKTPKKDAEEEEEEESCRGSRKRKAKSKEDRMERRWKGRQRACARVDPRRHLCSVYVCG